jgi:peptide/nickel transport system substrate-binding protein
MELNVIDNLTVGITLNEPMADLLDVLVTGYILPPDEVEKRGSDFAKAPVGTGPYRFAGYEEGIVIKAARNNDYWGIPPVYDAVEWVMVPDPSQRLLMLANGEADITAGPPFTTGIESPVNCVSVRGTTAYILIFNTTCKKLTDPRVRRAINLGVDRVALIDKVLNGAGYPLDGFISPAHFGYDPDSTGFPYDPDQALSLLADAGFGGGLKLTLDSPTSLPNEAVLLSNSLAEQLSEIDIELDIVYTEDRLEYANKVRLKDIHDLCVFDSSPLSTYRVLKEKVDSRFAGSWWQGYSNAEIEKLLDEAQVTVNYESREALYRKCYRLLNNDPPWLYLYNYQNLICTSSALIGLQPPVHNIIDLRYV